MTRLAFYAPMKPPTHPVPSGDRRVARLLMTALAAGGFEVELASRFRSRSADPARQAGRRTRGRGLASRLVEKYSARPQGARPRLWFTYHLYYKAPDWLGPEVAAGLGIPYVVAEASFAAKRETGPWSLGHAAARDAIAGADLVFNLNSADAAGVAKLRRGDGLVRLTPFVDAGPYRAAARQRVRHRRELSARLGFADSEPWLLAVAMMRMGDKLASYRVLGEALARLGARPWRLLVVGDGPARRDVEAAFAAVASRVRFMGRLGEAEIAPLYAASDLFVWPAVNEAYGMALLEAQASGLPAVAGRSGGVGDIVAEDVTGLLAAPADAAAFARAVAALLDAPPRRALMAEAALRRVQDQHGIEAAARTLAGALGRLLR